jgi:uncharacterized membrane protein
MLGETVRRAIKMYKLRSNIKLITNTWQSLTIFHQSLKTKTNNALIIVETMINLDISASNTEESVCLFSSLKIMKNTRAFHLTEKIM